MDVSAIINRISQFFSDTSAWLYTMQNANRGNGKSNLILGFAALVLIGIGIFYEWAYARPRRPRILARLWFRLPGVGKFLTGYERIATNGLKVQSIPLPNPQVQHPTPPQGLTQQQVQEQQRLGHANDVHVRTSRTYRQIFIANTFTRFNAIIACLYVVILFVGAPQDSLFGLIVVVNTLIGIVQELRAKWTLDRLAIATATKVRVRRDGQEQTVPSSTLVTGDLLVLTAGTSIPIDGVVTSSDGVEVNEGLVTGESASVRKANGDPVYSGSVVIGGKGTVQAALVGERAYAFQLAKAVRQFTLAKSEIRQGINQILRYVTWFLVPTALLLFITQIIYAQNGWRDAISASAGGVVNMVPDGLVLLTSVVMALAVVRLGQKRVLIQELPAVEMLARVDVLCVDKTGTLTEGAMAVEQVALVAADGGSDQRVKRILGAFAAEQHRTPTMQAIADHCPPPKPAWTVQESVAFSSDRKWSALTFAGQGTWVLGAPDFVLAGQRVPAPVQAQLARFLADGRRVLLLAEATLSPQHQIRTVQPTAFVVLREKLRAGVQKTLSYFQAQGVSVKVISGDDPRTVATVARAAGIAVQELQDGQHLPEHPASLGALLEQENVFGRILPEQKQRMVHALQLRGHTVAMVGDGINDVLAIKQADFSIAMGSGTEASRGTAQLVLLDNAFGVLPEVIAEGRRIIGNIERTANLFISKTAYVITMSIAVGLALSPFPFLPRHLTLIGFFTVGAPALLLSFRQNTARARSGFVSRVFNFSLPAGTTIAASVLVVYALVRQFAPGEIEIARTAATLCLFGSGLTMLVLLAQPMTMWLRIMFGALVAGMVATVAVPSIREVFGLAIPPLFVWALLLGVLALCILGLRSIQKHSRTFASHYA
jgi:cation-transporting P-type ATPase E